MSLKVALVVKNSASTQERECRNMGYWSYPVPEFHWQHFVFGGKRAYANGMNDFDVVIQEDAGPWHYRHLKRPHIFIAIDSTLSQAHLDTRLGRGKQADLILVDHDRLKNFEPLGVPIRRLNYCVNDRLMRDYGEGRDIDVSFHCAGNGQPERREVRHLLSEYCQVHDLTFGSGILPLPEYARAMARSKIIVNWPRTPANRPHRVFDAMACGACLVTGSLPDVPGDERVPDRDYIQVERMQDIPQTIDWLLESGKWQEVGQAGKRIVAKYHTWAIRAKQLRAILQEELGI